MFRSFRRKQAGEPKAEPHQGKKAPDDEATTTSPAATTTTNANAKKDDKPAANEETPLLRSSPPSEDRGRRYSQFYNDDPSGMTWGRRLAHFLSQFRWYYNPSLDHDGPSLDAAWAYFEHVTLARYVVPSSRSRSSVTRDALKKAESGETEKPTRLYSVWGTPEKDLGDFGLGIGTCDT